MSWPIGKQVPDFEAMAVFDDEFKKIKLSEYRDKYVVLFFWPRDFTFLCPTEITAFADRVKEFEAVNCQLLGCSTDSNFSHLAWAQQPREAGGLGGIPFPLLADPTYRISRQFGVLNAEQGYAYGSSFIIDAKRVLRQFTINDNQVGRNIDEILRVIQAFQYVDKHGEVCPANWRPGKSGIKVSLKKSDKS